MSGFLIAKNDVFYDPVEDRLLLWNGKIDVQAPAYNWVVVQFSRNGATKKYRPWVIHEEMEYVGNLNQGDAR